MILPSFTSTDHCVVENEAVKTLPVFQVKTSWFFSFSKCFRLQLPKNMILRIQTTLLPRPCTLRGDAVSPHSTLVLGTKKVFGLLYSPHFQFYAGKPGALGKLFRSNQSSCEDFLVMLLRSVRPWFICHISAAWATLGYSDTHRNNLNLHTRGLPHFRTVISCTACSFGTDHTVGWTNQGFISIIHLPLIELKHFTVVGG